MDKQTLNQVKNLIKTVEEMKTDLENLINDMNLVKQQTLTINQ